MKQNIEKLFKSILQKHYANYNNKYYKKIINASLEFPQSFTMPIYVRYSTDQIQPNTRSDLLLRVHLRLTLRLLFKNLVHSGLNQGLLGVCICGPLYALKYNACQLVYHSSLLLVIPAHCIFKKHMQRLLPSFCPFWIDSEFFWVYQNILRENPEKIQSKP